MRYYNQFIFNYTIICKRLFYNIIYFEKKERVFAFMLKQKQKVHKMKDLTVESFRNSSNIIVFSKTNCVQCKMSKRNLDALGVEYQEINLDEYPEFLDYVKDELGFKVLPVIQVPKHLGIENISGFRPNSIKELSKVC